MNFPFWHRRELVESLLAAPKDPVPSRRYCECYPVKFLGSARNSAWMPLWANDSVPSMNHALALCPRP